MMKQTITLIQFFLLNYSQRKNYYMVLVILLLGIFSSQFVSELSLIHSAEAQFSFQIELYRYGFILLSSLIIISNIADDFSSNQFDSYLAMPLSRWQYLVAQLISIAIINMALVAMSCLVLIVYSDGYLVMLWGLSMWMELMFCGFIALLAVLSLEKTPTAMMLFIGLYLLSRSSPIILEILEQSVYFSDGNLVNVTILMIFKVITYILPAQTVFVQNDLFFINNMHQVNLLQQAGWLVIYGFFINAISTFDFYRKEFSLSEK